jgi:hypothetical protein
MEQIETELTWAPGAESLLMHYPKDWMSSHEWVREEHGFAKLRKKPRMRVSTVEERRFSAA